MRWVALVLLLIAAFFGLTALLPLPAGTAWLLRPFADDSKPLFGFLGGPLNQSSNAIPQVLAWIAVICSLTSALGLFWKGIIAKWWPENVVVGAAASLLLCVLYLGVWTVVPILVDAVLIGGVLIGRWSTTTL
jgi:hypothetical protein